MSRFLLIMIIAISAIVIVYIVTKSVSSQKKTDAEIELERQRSLTKMYNEGKESAVTPLLSKIKSFFSKKEENKEDEFFVGEYSPVRDIAIDDNGEYMIDENGEFIYESIKNQPPPTANDLVNENF